MKRSRLNRAAAIAVLSAIGTAAPVTLSAQAPSPPPAPPTSSIPSQARVSAAGSYLAARHAGQQRDAQTAASYYRAALRHDPKNNELLDRTFLSLLVGGDVNDAVRYADRVLQGDKNDRIARLVTGVRDIKSKQYANARKDIGQSIRGPITDLAATLLSAWALAGAGDSKGAVAAIDKLTGPDWYGIFKELHAGLILDLAGNAKDAGKRLEQAHKLDSSALRVIQALGGWRSRNQSTQAALDLMEGFEKTLPNHPLVSADIKKLKAGEKLPVLVNNPQAGAAEALYGLGASLGRRGGEDLGLVYLQLSLYLVPNHPLALMSLADLYESLKKPELALRVYERVPTGSPLHRNAAIQMAGNLDAMERGEEAKKKLQGLLAERPNDVEAIQALGNIHRAHKEYKECGEAYSRAIALIPNPTKANWVTFYFRGICYERSKQWPLAEADLKKALELYPEQPHVLNYLGYSWVDQGVNLDTGMDMVKRAVALRPDDGYIVDSLGWAYYRIGNYEEAVKQLERAIELKPEDPTINDHLGDAYWRTGRTLEAQFQWAHARDLKPEAEELPKIMEKLANGLPDETTSQAKAGDKAAKKDGNGG